MRPTRAADFPSVSRSGDGTGFELVRIQVVVEVVSWPRPLVLGEVQAFQLVTS